MTSDILWHNSLTNETQFWFLDGYRVIGRATVLGESGTAAFVGPPWSIVGTGDFNGDGHADILWHNSSTNETQIWFLDGYRVTGRATVLGESGTAAFVGPPWSIVGTGDFNRNGKADILWHNGATNETQIWFLDDYNVTGRATVLGETGNPAFVGPPWSIVGTGDFNRDGNADILWHNSSTNETQIWFLDNYRVMGRATVLGESGAATFVGPPWSIVGAGDINRNGSADIIWHNSSTNETQIWFLDGYRVTGRATVLGESGTAAFVGPPWSIVGIFGVSEIHAGKFCDFLDPAGSPGVGINSYGLKDGHPRKSQLTFSVSGVIPITGARPPTTIANTIQIVQNAFNVWSAATAPFPNAAPRLSITPATGGQADITVGPGPLALPAIGNTTSNGQNITISTGIAWSAQNPVAAGTTSLLAVVTHEIGHALGLLHSTNPASIMFPFNRNVEALGVEDIAAIRALYGWAPQTSIPGIGTSAAPALCTCGNTLVMAWRGIGDDDQIWVARSVDGISWTPQHPIPGAGSADGPTLAWDGARVWLGIRGVPDDDGLYWATSNDLGDTWSGVTPVPGVGSEVGPVMAIFNGVPLLVWRGIEGDGGLYFSIWNAPSSAWSAQNTIGGTGSADRPGVCVDFSGIPRVVWRGIPGDDRLYTSTLVGQFWQPQQLVEWVIAGNGPAGTVGIGVPGSAVGPSVTSVGGRMLLVWRGVSDDNGIYFTQAAAGPGGQPPVEWSTQAEVPGIGSSHQPAIAALNGRIFLAWKGIDDDNTIYTTVG